MDEDQLHGSLGPLLHGNLRSLEVDPSSEKMGMADFLCA